MMRFKKSLSFILATLLLLGLIGTSFSPIVSAKADDPVYVVAQDSDFVWKTGFPWSGAWHYVGSDEYVEIPHTINGNPVTSYRWMFRNTSVKGVKSTNSAIVNMSWMFAGSQATILDLSNLDTSNVTDMSGMFSWSRAAALDLSSFNTSNVTNMTRMFESAQAANLDLSSFDTSNVTDMNSMFSGSQAMSLNLSSFDTSNVTDMSGMFSWSRAAALDLSSFNTSKVTDMWGMFQGSQTTSLDLSSFDTSNVTNMNSMFQDSQAASLDLSSFDTSNVTNMNSMFRDSQAASLDLSSFNTSNVTLMQSMFQESQATSLDLSSFDTSKVTHMDAMFMDSQAITLDLSSFNTLQVSGMSWMFYGAKAPIIDLSSFNMSNVADTGWMFGDAHATTGWARTQADADILNATSDKPEDLIFQIRQIHTITFDTQGGSSIDDIAIQGGELLTRPIDPTKTGETFDDWYLDEALTQLFDFNTPITSDMTLYAKFNPLASGYSGPEDISITLNESIDGTRRIAHISVTPAEGTRTRIIAVFQGDIFITRNVFNNELIATIHRDGPYEIRVTDSRFLQATYLQLDNRVIEPPTIHTPTITLPTEEDNLLSVTNPVMARTYEIFLNGRRIARQIFSNSFSFIPQVSGNYELVVTQMDRSKTNQSFTVTLPEDEPPIETQILHTLEDNQLTIQIVSESLVRNIDVFLSNQRVHRSIGQAEVTLDDLGSGTYTIKLFTRDFKSYEKTITIP